MPQDAGVDHANYMRCISGTYYNITGSLYQATRYGAAVPFLSEACFLGAKALSIIGSGKGKGKAKEEANWKLIAVCYSKNGDRKVISLPFC